MSLDQALRNDHGMNLMTALNSLGRLAQGARDPEWARRYRELLDRTYDAGDTRLVLTLLETYAASLIAVDRFESAATLIGFLEPRRSRQTPLARARADAAREKLEAALGPERLATLTLRGAARSIDDAVALARAELDLVIEVPPAHRA